MRVIQTEFLTEQECEAYATQEGLTILMLSRSGDNSPYSITVV
jgi:hypothetical protein